MVLLKKTGNAMEYIISIKQSFINTKNNSKIEKFVDFAARSGRRVLYSMQSCISASSAKGVFTIYDFAEE